MAAERPLNIWGPLYHPKQILATQYYSGFREVLQAKGQTRKIPQGKEIRGLKTKVVLKGGQQLSVFVFQVKCPLLDCFRVKPINVVAREPNANGHSLMLETNGENCSSVYQDRRRHLSYSNPPSPDERARFTEILEALRKPSPCV